MYLDFKITAWERVYIPEEIKEEVLEALKTGKVQTSNDVTFMFDDKGVYFEGLITEIEFLDDDGEEPIFKNGK